MIGPLDLDDHAGLDAVRDLRFALHEYHAALPTPPGFGVRDRTASWEQWRAAAVALVAAGDAVLLAHRDDAGAVDGMAFVRVLDQASQQRPVVEATSPQGELVTLVVADGARNAGIGAALVDAAAQWCRGRGLAAMHVVMRSDNAAARRFYVAHGAQPTWETLLVPL